MDIHNPISTRGLHEGLWIRSGEEVLGEDHLSNETNNQPWLVGLYRGWTYLVIYRDYNIISQYNRIPINQPVFHGK